MKRPVITLLTDFGSTEHYVAAMKGVMLGICPDLGAGFHVRLGAAVVSRLLETYADAGDDEPFAIWGSAGYLEISCNRRSAAQLLRVAAGSQVFLAEVNKRY